MDISDYIGVIIAVIVMIIAIFQQIRAAFRKEPGMEEQGEELPSSVKKQQRQRVVRENISERKPVYRQTTTSIPQPFPRGVDAYKILPRKAVTSRGRLLLQKIPSKQEMVILSEIIGPPKGFQL